MKQFRRDKIRMYAFLTACFIVLVLLSTVGVFAASSGDMGVLYDITDDDILYYDDSETHSAPFITDSSPYDGYLKACVSNSFLCTYNNVLSALPDETIYTNYAVFLQQGYIFFLALPEGSFFTFNDSVNRTYLYAPTGYYPSGNSLRICGLQYNNDGSYHAYYDINPQSYKNNIFSYDGENYGCIATLGRGVGNINDTIFMSSVPIYYTSDSTMALDNVDWDNNYNSSMGSDTSDVETASNNLYFPTSDFRFRINRYGEYYSGTAKDGDSATTDFAKSNYSEYKNSWGTGNIDFSAVLTDYQKEHPEEFTLNFEFNLQENIWLDCGEDISYNFLFCKYHLNCNTYTYSMGLDDFYRNGSIKTFSVQDIFSNMSIKNYSTQYNSINAGQMFVLDVSDFSNYYDFVNATKTDSRFEGCLFGSDSTSPWKITCGVYLSSSNEHSGYNKESYSFISQVSRQIDDGMSDNDNPYVPSEDDSSNLPDDNNSSNSSTSSSSGGNTLINNDNDTININDGNGEVVEDIYNDLTSSDGEDSLSERFVNLVNENAWITIMQETFSFIPSSIWVSVEIFVVTALGILAASFVLRIILDLL